MLGNYFLDSRFLVVKFTLNLAKFVFIPDEDGGRWVLYLGLVHLKYRLSMRHCPIFIAYSLYSKKMTFSWIFEKTNQCKYVFF